jgi:aminocarboxymuconate-semialdehyde decarboxylase
MTKTPADLGGWDVHSHLIPDGVIKAADTGAYGMAHDEGKLQVCGHGVPLTRISKTAKLLDRIAADGLDGAVVSVPPPLFRPDLDQTARGDYAGFVNDALLDAVQIAPRTLRPFAYLPAEDPELSARIAAGLDSAWAGCVIGTDLAGLLYSDPRYDALWQTLSDNKLPVFLHPGSSPDKRLTAFYLTNLLGNPYETALAAAHLVFGGVFDRHPALGVILAHGGGCAAALAGRWQRGADTDRPGVEKRTLPPGAALKKFHYDSLVHAPAYLDYLIETVGVDRIVLGSDWPFPMGSDDAARDIGQLPAEIQLTIRKTNAERLFSTRLTTPAG